MPGVEIIAWQVPDPHGAKLDAVREIREYLKQQVRGGWVGAGGGGCGRPGQYLKQQVRGCCVAGAGGGGCGRAGST